MKIKNYILLFLATLYFSIAVYGQELRTIDTDFIAPNAPGGDVTTTAPTSINNSTIAVTDVLDEDTMVTNSATAVATQQSIRAYVDNEMLTIDNLGDVTITAPSAAETLSWNGAAWVNGLAILASIDDITDVTITSALTGETLTWNGSAWVNSHPVPLWLTGTTYVIGNLVIESNHLYRALTNHVGGTFATDLTNNEWVEIIDSDKLTSIASSTDNAVIRWDGTTGDTPQDSVVLIGDTGAITGVESIGVGGAVDASSLLDFTSTTKGSRPCPSMTEANRDLIAAPATGLCVFNTDTTVMNIHNGLTWVAVGGGSGGGVDKWLTLTTYAIDDLVHLNNRLYKALTNHTSGTFATDLLADAWVEVSRDVMDWVTTTAYKVGNVVIESNKIYQCQTDHTSGTFATDLGSAYWTLMANTLGETTDVTITAAADGDYLRHNGSAWVDAIPALDDNSDVIESGSTTGHVLEHDGATYVNRLPWSNDFFDGSVVEIFDVAIASVAEAGGDCTAAGEADPCLKLTIEKSGGGDLTYIRNGIESVFDTTPAASYVLTSGTDTVPITNYVWVEWSGSAYVIDSNTSGFPSSQWYSPIGAYVVRSVATTGTEGVFSWQNYTDHLSNGVGHIIDLNDKVRQSYPEWYSGSLLTPTITVNGGAPDNVDVAIAAGVVYQLHKQTTEALDSSTGDTFHIVNDSVTAYKQTADLNTELTDAAGASLSGKDFSFVIWGVASKTGVGANHIMVNLPVCSYNSSPAAITDANNCSVYSIPPAFKRTGYLISKLTFNHSASASGTWTLQENENLLSLTPSTAAGGGLSGGSVEFPDSVFRVQDDTDPTKEIALEASGITTGTTRTFTAPDGSGTIALASGLAGGQTITGGTAASENLTLSSTSDGTKGNIIASENIIVPVGANNDASIQSVGDPDTGPYFPAANTYALTAGNSVKLWATTTDMQLGDIASNPVTINNSGYLTSYGEINRGTGICTTPGYRFFGDTDSGLCQSGADAVGLVTGGVTAIAVDSSQHSTFAGDVIMNSPSSTTVPHLILNSGDLNTGFSWCGSDAICLVSGGATRKKVAYNAATVYVPLYVDEGTVGTPAITFQHMVDGGWWLDETGNDSISENVNGVVKRNAADEKYTYNTRLVEGDISGMMGKTHRDFLRTGFAKQSITIATDITSGNNATFDGGGTLVGTLSRETTGLIDASDVANYKYAGTAGDDTGDFWYHTTAIMDEDYKTAYIKFNYTYSGTSAATGDIHVVYKCSTSGFVYPARDLEVAATSTTYSDQVTVADGCGNIKAGFHIITDRVSSALLWNRYTINNSPHSGMVDSLVEDTVELTGYTSQSSGNVLFKTTVINDNKTLSIDTASSYTKIIALVDLKGVTASASLETTGGPSTLSIIAKDSGGTTKTVSKGLLDAHGEENNSISWTGDLLAGEYLIVNTNQGTIVDDANNDFFNVTAKTQSENYSFPKDVYAPSIYETNTATSFAASSYLLVPFEDKIIDDDSLVDTSTWKWTAPKSGVVNVGAFINVTTAAWVAGEQLILEVYKNGAAEKRIDYYMFPYARTAPVGLGNNVAVDVVKGDYLDVRFYHDRSAGNAALSGTSRANWVNVHYIDGGGAFGGIPVQQTMYIKETRASGTAAGAASANTVHTRSINEISGDILGTLSSSRFKLCSGKFKIASSAPSWKTAYHQTFIYNYTDSSYEQDCDGTSEYSAAADGVQTRSHIKCTLIPVGCKEYELRHWTNAARAVDGLGLPADQDASNPQGEEVYAIIEVTKIKDN